MMVRLLDALECAEDIGHYGRLTFTMVARFFMSEDQLVQLLAKQPEQGETDATALVMQAATHDYSPPTRERILTWQREQAYQIIPDPNDPNSGNVYKELRFPDEVYEHIGGIMKSRQKLRSSERIRVRLVRVPVSCTLHVVVSLA